MNVARRSAPNHESERFKVSVEPSGKAVEPLSAGAAQTSVKSDEQHKPVHKRREKKADAWMEGIGEFIRKIDVTSL